MPAYDPNNPFAKILRGEFPCYKVYEDEHTLAFLDIMPRCPGHTLVIPKAPARNILDITPDDFAHVARVGQKIATETAESPRPARSCVSSPPNEWPMTAGLRSSLLISSSTWSAICPMFLRANASRCAFASSTVCGSSGQPALTAL